MPKRPHITIVESLTDSIVTERIATGKQVRLFDTGCPGLYLFIGDKSGGSTWFYASASKGTPALGPHIKFTVEQARQRALSFGPPSRKVSKIIGSTSKNAEAKSGENSSTIASSKTTPPPAPSIEFVNALVAEMVEARWRDMRPKIAEFIRIEIAKGIERAMREMAR